jgi:hypothetical protein
MISRDTCADRGKRRHPGGTSSVEETATGQFKALRPMDISATATTSEEPDNPAAASF